MKNRIKLALISVSVVASILILIALSYGKNFAVLNPAGHIADRQIKILIFASLLSLVVLIPVFTLTIYIVWKYRATKKSEHKPDWDSNKWLEFIWWGIPITLIAILGTVTWRTSHELDPSKPIDSQSQSITIQVVALEWKWLFIYPNDNIATVNYLKIPKDTPINFEITSDSAMNSFWIPNLGGQIYAMTGMSSKLHLVASKQGSYPGVSANISGEGFADMKFQTDVTSNNDYQQWIQQTKKSPEGLSQMEYIKLAKPSKNTSPIFYSSVENDLYQNIISKYMSSNLGRDYLLSYASKGLRA